MYQFLCSTIRVYKTPFCYYGERHNCINSSEEFEGVLTAPDSTITWQWSFGNGASSQVQNPSVIYSSAGDFNIQLIAANKLGLLGFG
jgi:PKD repeat protein